MDSALPITNSVIDGSSSSSFGILSNLFSKTSTTLKVFSLAEQYDIDPMPQRKKKEKIEEIEEIKLVGEAPDHEREL